MKNYVCFTLVFALCSFAYANRSEKLKRNIVKREEIKEQKREIARAKEAASKRLPSSSN